MLSSLNELFSSTSEVLSINQFGVLIVSALIMGVILSLSIQYKNLVSKSFAVTVAVLPPIVCSIIMMVNGSIGAGIAVAGTFSLVRFRSIPGTAKEISAVFVAMAIGLACGMGNLGYAAVFTIIIISGMLILENTSFGESKLAKNNRIIRITIPEDLDYTNIFDDLLNIYTSSYHLKSVKTTNLGSMFKLTYHVVFHDPSDEKEFIDKIRVRNGNLEITSSMMTTVSAEL